jgi:hypothetical protein
VIKHVIFRLCLGGMALVGLADRAYASGSCEETFQTRGDVRTGLQFYAGRDIPGIDPVQGANEISEILKSQGLEIYKVLPGSTASTVDAGPSRVYGIPAYISHFIIRQNAPQVMVSSYVKPGAQADPEDAKKKLCAVLASLAQASQSDARTAPPSSRASNVTAQTERAVPTHTNAPPDASDINVLRPSVAFDEAAAKAALVPGTATISGTACVRHHANGEGGALALAANQKILLFPDTPYLEAFVKLMHDAKPGRDKVDADPKFMVATMTATTNSKGQFRFAQMKAGRYYLFTTMAGNIDNAQLSVSHDYADGGHTMVETQSIDHYTTSFADILDKFVDVSDGQTVDITLTGHPHLLKMLIHPNDNGGYAGIIGCK